VLQGKHVPGIGLNPIYERHSVPQLPEVKAAMEAVATEAA
jgi:2-oxoisovalerate dehydrogenase E1 component beta subunit